MAVTKEHVLEALRRVQGPDRAGDIVGLGLVSDIVVADGKVIFSITVPADQARELEPLRRAAESAVRELPGVEQCDGGADRRAPPGRAGTGAAPPRAAAAPRRGSRRAAEGRRARASTPSSRSPPARAASASPRSRSTSRSACRRSGCSVGILDADIYGPSMPRLLGLRGRPEVALRAAR